MSGSFMGGSGKASKQLGARQRNVAKQRKIQEDSTGISDDVVLSFAGMTVAKLKIMLTKANVQFEKSSLKSVLVDLAVENSHLFGDVG